LFTHFCIYLLGLKFLQAANIYHGFFNSNRRGIIVKNTFLISTVSPFNRPLKPF